MIEIKKLKTLCLKNYFKLAATFKTKDGKEYEGTYVENEEDKFKNKETWN